MRKFLAAFFLFIFTFNVGGYYLIFWGLQYHASRQIASLADTGTYTSTDEIAFHIPLTLPYTLEQDEFTRANGSFEYDGEFYQVVKQRIVDSQLVLVCIKNHQQKKITRALSDIVKADHLPGDARQTLRTLARLFKDFQSAEASILHTGNAWSTEVGLTAILLSSDPPCTEIAAPPPRPSCI